MKYLKTVNKAVPYITSVYELKELRGTARISAYNHIRNFILEIDMENDLYENDYPDDVIENIAEANMYTFDVRGNMLPIIHFMEGHPDEGMMKILIFGEYYECKLFTTIVGLYNG